MLHFFPSRELLDSHAWSLPSAFLLVQSFPPCTGGRQRQISCPIGRFWEACVWLSDLEQFLQR